MESILTSIKKLLGIGEDYEHFDPDIIMHINSVFMDLTQMGVGPSYGFAIEDDISEWTDFIPDTRQLQAVKSYIYLRVKLLFDPPTSSSVMEAMNRDIQRYEWRLNVAAESIETDETDNDDSNTSGSGSGVTGVIDYRDLINKPRLNGKTIVDNVNEQDPTVKQITSTSIDKLFNDEFNG